jgi:hypothetical protein
MDNQTQTSTGIANSGTAGYWAGGTQGQASVNKIQKLTFSNETRSNLGAVLSQTRFASAGLQNKGVAGYVVSGAATTGGYNYSAPTDTSKLNFSNETSSSFNSLVRINSRGVSNEGSI